MNVALIGGFHVAVTVAQWFHATQAREVFICPGCNRVFRSYPGNPSPCCGAPLMRVTK